SWAPIPDTGTGATHSFKLSTAGQPRGFLRYAVTPP
ncbi:MAG: hypothetical protein RLZZ522_1598, partial [Verrucomicrobiota bacterium]